MKEPNLRDDLEGPPEPETTWLTTFADLSLLLLTFFVLLVSMSSLEVNRFKSVFGSMRDAFGGVEMPAADSGGQAERANDADAVKEFMRIREEMLAEQRLAYNEIRSFLTTRGMDGQIGAVMDEGVITLTVPDSVLFASGSEAIEPEAEPTLRNLLLLFKTEREQSVNIKGYTDNSPVPPGSRYRNNWELSALRAVNVLRWFVDAGLPVVRFTATGMGDLNPLYPNDSPENQARNRRVEFSLERRIGSAK